MLRIMHINTKQNKIYIFIALPLQVVIRVLVVALQSQVDASDYQLIASMLNGCVSGVGCGVCWQSSTVLLP